VELRTCPCSSNYLGQAVDAVKAGRFGRFALVLRGSQEAAGARRAILTQVDAGAVFAVPVYTFDQLATVLMRRLDIEPKGSVSEIQRELLVSAALAQCKIAGELGPLAQGAERDGVARSLAELFAVMDGAGLDPERLEKALITGSGGGMEMVSNFGHDAVDNLSPCIDSNRIPSAHAADVLSVWRRYCELLDFTGRAERGRLYSAIAQSLRSAEGRSRHGLESVRVAGYAWIGGLEAVLLSALAEASVDVEIELRCPPGHGGYALDAMEEAVSPARVVGVELPARQTPPRLIAAAGPRREACAVAREIKRLIVDEGVRPAQVCVASADSEGFVPMFLEALDEFQVPATVSRKRLMIESSLVLDCLEVARLLGAIGRPFDIMPLVASPYLGLGPRRAGQIARAINLKGLELPLAGWEAKLEKCDPSGDCDGQRYAALLAEAAEQAEDVRRASGSPGLAGYVDGFRAALARLGMPDRIFASTSSPTSSGGSIPSTLWQKKLNGHFMYSLSEFADQGRTSKTVAAILSRSSSHPMQPRKWPYPSSPAISATCRLSHTSASSAKATSRFRNQKHAPASGLGSAGIDPIPAAFARPILQRDLILASRLLATSSHRMGKTELAGTVWVISCSSASETPRLLRCSSTKNERRASEPSSLAVA
jgi:hypothetical protein